MSKQETIGDTKTGDEVPKLKIKKRLSKSALGRTDTESKDTKLNRAKTGSYAVPTDQSKSSKQKECKPGWNRTTKVEASLKEMSLVSGIRETQENIDALTFKPYVNSGHKKVSKKKKKEKEGKTDKYVFRKESEENKEERINLRQRRKSDSSATTYSDSGKLPNTAHMIDQTTLIKASKENEKSAVPEAASGFNFTVREPASYTGFYTQFDSLYTNLLRHENLIEDESDYKYFVRSLKKDIHSYVKARNREENFNLVHRDVYDSFKKRVMDLEERYQTNARRELKNAYSNRSSHHSRSRHIPINTNEPTHFAENESFFYVKK